MLEIKLSGEIGTVTFGMTPEEVMSVFGSTQIYEDWMGGNLNNSLLYHGVILGFDRCNAYGPLADSRLVEFTVFNREDITFCGKPFLQWEKSDLLENFKNFGINLTRENEFCSSTVCFEMDFDDNEHLLWLTAFERAR